MCHHLDVFVLHQSYRVTPSTCFFSLGLLFVDAPSDAVLRDVCFASVVTGRTVVVLVCDGASVWCLYMCMVGFTFCLGFEWSFL